MNIRHFSSNDLCRAIRQVRQELGPDAVILSSEKSDDGIEMVAAVDYGTAAEAPILPLPAFEIPESIDAGLVREAKPDTGRELPMQSPRDVLETHLSRLLWNERSRRAPIETQAMRNLSRLGLSAELVKRIIREVGTLTDHMDAWQATVRWLAAHIPTVPRETLPDCGVIALIGPTGSGKTTAIAGLAARYTLAHGRGSVAILSMSDDAVETGERRRARFRMTGVPEYAASDATELSALLRSLSRTRLLLLDAPGMGESQSGLQGLDYLFKDKSLGLRCLLTLSANMKPERLHRLIDAVSGVEPQGCVLTNIDKATSLGGVLSVLIDRDLSLAWVSDGQRMPGNIHPAALRRDWLVQVAIDRLRESRQSISEHYMAENFAETLSHANP